ncbi:hypothetical protein LUZ60_014618 [Juncus effusus]|nr:hypothetical protein LUZ60_014618 [Juncus effusus]
MSESKNQLKDLRSADLENPECRLYVGNLDYRISEANIIKMFSAFGKIVSEDFLLHKKGPKSGEPRGYAFVQFTSKEEAKLAKEKMNGKLIFGRPLVVRLSTERISIEGRNNLSNFGHPKAKQLKNNVKCDKLDRNAKIAAIRNKLKSLEGEGSSVNKRPKFE